MEMVQQLAVAVVAVVIGVLSSYLVGYIKAEAARIKNSTTNEMISKYVGIAESIVTDTVIMVNQTFVDELKKKGEFTKESMSEAYKRCVDVVKESTPQKAFTLIELMYGDFYVWLNTQIEKNVRLHKN